MYYLLSAYINMNIVYFKINQKWVNYIYFDTHEKLKITKYYFLLKGWFTIAPLSNNITILDSFVY